MRLYVTILFVIINSVLFAQKAGYNVSLANAVATFNSSNNNTDYTHLIQDLEKLDASNSKDWLPSYYLALIHVRISINNEKDADIHADKALYWARKSIGLNVNDETYCIFSMAHIAKMAVNPLMRFVKYQSLIYDNLNKAKKINPNNPRIYILEAKLQMNLPRIFGGGCKQAKPLIIKAKQLLESQASQAVLPTWGHMSLNELKEGCPI
ncbi:MAG: hypothetical protein RIR55_1532 [Bacteroidota bacterium]|jgi:hypothetical protein